MTLFFFTISSLSLGNTRIFLSVLPPLKYTATPCFLLMFLMFSHMPGTYGMTMWLLFMGLLVVLLGVCFFSFLCCCLKIFLMAHLGYLHWPSTSSRWISSFSRSLGVEQMVCALRVKVLMTLYLADKLWLLSHGK